MQMSRYIAKTLIIITISGLVISLGFVLLLITSGNKETVKLRNNFNGETICLIKKSWGFGDSKIAIGLNTRLWNGFNISQNDKYIETTGIDIIFYKLDSGKLYIYNDTFKKPTRNKFHTEIVFIGLSNTEFYNLRENFNYKTKSLSVFPEIDKRLKK